MINLDNYSCHIRLRSTSIYFQNGHLVPRTYKLPAIIKVTVKQSRYRPGVAQRFPGSYGSQISWQSHRMVVRLSGFRTGRLCPQEIRLGVISVRGWVDPRAIVRPEGLCHWKIPMTPLGIEPATCRFVAQCLNRYATACPHFDTVQTLFRITKHIKWLNKVLMA